MAGMSADMEALRRSQQVMAVVEEIRKDYETSLEKYAVGSSEREAAKRAVHLRSAERLLEIAKEFGGVFNKAAQFVASIQGPIPREYTQTLGVLVDRAPFKPIEDMRKVIHEDLGEDSTLYKVRLPTRLRNYVRYVKRICLG